MFAVHCPAHGARVLLGPRSILALANTDDGVVVEWRCSCGTTGTQRFGRQQASTSGQSPAPVLDPAA